MPRRKTLGFSDSLTQLSFPSHLPYINMQKVIFYFIGSCIFLSQLSLSAQPDQLNALQRNVVEQLQTVEDKKFSYDQSWAWDEKKPYSVTFKMTKTNQKGDSESMTYRFNLADFNKNAIKWSEEKDKIVVVMTTDSKEKVIQVFKEDQMQKYINQIELVGFDLDNAKALEESLELLIEPAKKQFEQELNLANFDERKEWIVDNIQAFTIEDDEYSQSVMWDEEVPGLMSYQLNKRKKEETWQFNLADLHVRKIDLKIKGREVWVIMNTDGRKKYIAESVDGVLTKFGSKVSIALPSIDLAR